MGRDGSIASRGLAFLLAAFLLAGGGSVRAAGPVTIEEKEVGPFRVTNASLQVEDTKAEICLFFSHPLDTEEREAFLAAIDLRKDGKKESLSARDISLTTRALCLQNLAHRAKYDFLLRRIKSAAGERLAKPYTAAFTVPDRKPFLAFVSDSNLPILPRHVAAKKGVDPFQPGMAHVLRSVNVPQTHLTLYRIADRDSFVRAWQQFKLINLSPLESLVFAKEKGQAVFESDLVFGENPNTEQTLVAPLPPDASLTPGLYYLAASPGTKDETEHKLFAGQWFLVSDLRLSAFRMGDGVEVFAGELSSRKPAPDVAIRVLASNGDVLGEAKTGADGGAFVSLPDKKSERVFLLTGSKATGDVDMLDIGQDKPIDSSDLPIAAFVQADRAFYQPGSTAAVLLRAEDSSGKSLDVGGSALKLLRPDRRAYSQQVVPANKDGARLMNVVLPYAGKAGTWFLSWQKDDGAVIAETPFLLAPEAGDDRLELQLLESGAEGHVKLLVKATNKDGKPLAFKTGKLAVYGAQPQVAGWDAFRFGVAPEEKAPPLRELSFLTGADGKAVLSFEHQRKWDALEARATLEEEGTAASLSIPTHRFASLIGIKPLIEGKAFPENGLARFELIALDAAGKRRAENDLFTVIYEEGRRFDWFPSEGHWDYRPLPQHRRVGGGPLSLAASGDNVIRWPVTTGQYVLEVTDADGFVLARRAFEAGRVTVESAAEESAKIKPETLPASLEEGKENKIRFRLSAPAFVSAVVYDGQRRQTFFRFLPAGLNEMIVTPGEAWGNRALIRLQAYFSDSLLPAAFSRLIDIHQPRRDLSIEATAPKGLTTGAGIVLPVRVQKIKGRAPTYLSVVSTPLSSDGQTDLPVVRLDKIPLEADGRAKIKLNPPLFDGALRLALIGWNEDQYGQKTLIVPARPALAVRGEMPQRLGLGDKIEVSLTIANNAAPAGSYDYELHLPDGLAADQSPKGKISLARGQTQTLLFTLTARDETEDNVRFDLAGPQNARFSQAWPVAVSAPKPAAWDVQARKLDKGKAVSLPLRETKSLKDGTVDLLAPLALPDVTEALQRLAWGVPATTREIALWLEASHLWQEILGKFGFAGSARIENLRSELFRQLQQRQNDDGGFPVLASGTPSDISSTAAALIVLRDRAEKPFGLAASWLENKLQNTWFDEKERGPRIEALEALARAHRADLASLRYFAETSRSKDLEDESAVLLGLALVEGGDEEAGSFWNARARKLLPDLADGDPAAFWAVLGGFAANEKLAADELQRALPSEMPELDAVSLEDASVGLIALAEAAQRFGTWKTVFGGRDMKGYGLTALRFPDDFAATGTAAPVSLTPDRPLYLLEAAPGPEGKTVEDGENGLTLANVFFKPDGSAFDFDLSLMKGETYVLLIQGEGREPEPVRLVLPRSSALVYALPEKQALRTAFPWLPETLIDTPEKTVMPSGAVLSFTPEARAWKVAVLVRAMHKGSFSLPAPRVLSASGELLPVTQNAIRFSVW